tara:strand:- start:260 stop:658 length:399 start_codon:yes stop_codon:yes gene_type:complete
MSWASVLKKNNKQFEQKPTVKEEKVDEFVIEEEYDDCYRDPNEEFEYKYSSKITNIVIDFEDYLLQECLPFNDKCVLDKTFDLNYTFHDFIKFHSKDYKKICEHAEEYNNEIDRKIEEENKKLEEEENEYDI